MREENKRKRQVEIEKAAYSLLQEEGYGNLSMLKIAKRAKASNETLYRWYGDKTGLFKALVSKNAQDAKELLESAIKGEKTTDQALRDLAPLLLSILLGPQAIALNQAAAADPTGELGAAIAERGRATIFPLIVSVLERGGYQQADKAADLYVTLLVGDMQIRRVIGQFDVPDKTYIANRAETALVYFQQLTKPN